MRDKAASNNESGLLEELRDINPLSILDSILELECREDESNADFDGVIVFLKKCLKIKLQHPGS